MLAPYPRVGEIQILSLVGTAKAELRWAGRTLRLLLWSIRLRFSLLSALHAKASAVSATLPPPPSHC